MTPPLFKILGFSLLFFVAGCMKTALVPSYEQMTADGQGFSCQQIVNRLDECDRGCPPDSANLFCHLSGHASGHFEKRKRCKEGVLKSLEKQKALSQQCVVQSEAKLESLTANLQKLSTQKNQAAEKLQQARDEYTQMLKGLSASENDLVSARAAYDQAKAQRNALQQQWVDQKAEQEMLVKLQFHQCAGDQACEAMIIGRFVDQE